MRIKKWKIRKFSKKTNCQKNNTNKIKKKMKNKENCNKTMMNMNKKISKMMN